MKRHTISLIAFLVLNVLLSAAPASACTRPNHVATAFVLMLGVGY
jgi:hypothetical protein